MRRGPRNPNPQQVPQRVLGLLLAWAEWRSTQGCPRAVRLPQEAGRWVLDERGGITWLEGVEMPVASTRRPEPGPVQIMGQAVGDLDKLDKMVLLAYVDQQAAPWLKGEGWQKWLSFLSVTRPEYGRLLASALRNLTVRARARGLLRAS